MENKRRDLEARVKAAGAALYKVRCDPNRTADEYLAAINEYFEALKELRKSEAASS